MGGYRIAEVLNMNSKRYQDKLAESDYLSAQLPVVICPFCQSLAGEEEMIEVNDNWHCSSCRPQNQ